MNTTRRGKIARLPRAVRQELNRRLADGEEGKKLVAWLNGLPEVRAIVAGEFGGQPIREQSLSEWRKGGHRDWLAQQEALEVAERLGEDVAEWNTEGRPPLTDALAFSLAARIAVAMRRVAETGGEEGWKMLHELFSDVIGLRRGDHSAARLRLERERERKKTEEEHMAWAMENRERLCAGFRTNAERIAMLRKAMFDDLDDPELNESVRESLREAEKPTSGKGGCGGIFSNPEMDKPAAEPAENPKP